MPSLFRRTARKPPLREEALYYFQRFLEKGKFTGSLHTPFRVKRPVREFFLYLN